MNILKKIELFMIKVNMQLDQIIINTTPQIPKPLSPVASGTIRKKPMPRDEFDGREPGFYIP